MAWTQDSCPKWSRSRQNCKKIFHIGDKPNRSSFLPEKGKVFYLAMEKLRNVGGMEQNYDYLKTNTYDMQRKKLIGKTMAKEAGKPVNLSISEEGRNMLRQAISQFEPEPDDSNVRELTIQKTNEVAWEHYMAMRSSSSLTLKAGNYNVEDVMQSIMDTYESRYHEIIKKHESGDREVSYELTGKRSLTLDEDLAGLDEAFKMCLANLEGYITCQQTNKAFEHPDSSWYFRRNSIQNGAKTQDKVQLFDTQYQKNAVSIMEQAKEKFLAAFGSRNMGKKSSSSI